MKKFKVSNNVIRRLPRYLRKLDELNENGVSRISSFDLGQQLGLTPSQIRQDFSNFGEFGQQGYGYNVTALRTQIAGILGFDRGYKVIVIGVGNLGRALLCNFKFSEWGFEVLAAFDANPELVGKEYNGTKVLASQDLEQFIANNHTDAAVLCVPKSAAVSTASFLLSNGVGAIWNFTNVELVEPGDPAIIENIHFSDSLLSMSYYITKKYEDAIPEE